jgi:hypothetical protein
MTTALTALFLAAMLWDDGYQTLALMLVGLVVLEGPIAGLRNWWRKRQKLPPVR